MKKVSFLVALALFVSACDDRLDFLTDLNQPPNISILFEGQTIETTLSDSIKISLKAGNSPYNLSLRSVDPERFAMNVGFRVISGTVKVYQDGAEVSGGLAYTNEGISNIQIEPQGVGQVRVEFFATDNLGNTDVVTFSGPAFINVPPVAVIDLVRVSVNSPLEHDFIANRSIDPDKGLGGGIVRYEWDVNGVKFLSEAAVSRFIFPNIGTYEIKLRVQDNDGAFSPVVSRILTIN